MTQRANFFANRVANQWNKLSEETTMYDKQHNHLQRPEGLQCETIDQTLQSRITTTLLNEIESVNGMSTFDKQISTRGHPIQYGDQKCMLEITNNFFIKRFANMRNGLSILKTQIF